MGKDNKSENADFREKAEELLQTDTSKSVSVIFEAEMLKQIHELEVSQNALKIQNEELRTALIDHMRVDELLIASENRYRILFESAKDGILILDAETGMITDVNPFLIEMLGYSEDQFCDKAIWEIGFFKDLIANQNKFLEIQQNEFVRYDDLPLETADGRKISVEFVSNSYFEDQKKVIQCNIREITKRKDEALALRNSEFQHRTLIQTIPDLIWLKDTEGVYLSCNIRFERFFGAREADIIGKTDYDFVDRDLADFFRENDRKAMAAGKSTSNEEWVTFANDGHREFLDTIKTPIYDSDGMMLGILGIGRDITERKYAAQKVRASEKRFRAIFDQAPIAIALIDMQGHPIISNLSLSKMLGYTSDELSKMMFTEFTYPEDINKDMNQFADLIEGKISGYSMEKRYIHKNGTLIWANLFVTTLNDNNGLPQEIIGMVEDITERKKAEDALLESEVKYRAFFENNMDAILLTSPDGKTLSANQASCHMFGYSEDELIKLGRSGIFDMSDSRLLILLEERKRIGKARGEVTLIRKDGTRFPAEISSAIFKNYEGSERNSIIIRDITLRIDSEKALRKSEEKFRSYIDNAPDGVFVVDESGRYIDVNNAACTMSGYTENELLKMSISDILAEASFEDGLSHFNTLIQNDKSRSELSFKHKDGSIRWWSLDAVKLTESRFLGFTKDITERKKAEKELQESELRFRTLYDNAKIGLYRTTFDGNILMANKALLKMLGYSSFEKLAERNLEKEGFEPTYHRKKFIEMIEKDDVINDFECAWVRMDGSVFFVRESAQVIRDSQGKILYYDGIVEDITERKQAETEIAILAHSLKSINECVSITDLENKILFVNESFLKTYGYELNELIGENISVVRSQSYGQGQLDEILPATLNGEWHGELMNRKKDGTEFPVYLSTTMIKDKENNVLGLIGVASDITERKRIQNELKFQANLLSNVGQAVIATDLHGRVIYWNNAAEKIYGWSSTEVIGRNIISITPAQTTLEQATQIMKNLSEGNSWTGEFLVKRKDSSNFLAFVINAPFFNSKGEFAGVIGISNDITERKLAETELIIAKEKAEESDRLKSAFLANMSHEVRTPLNSIIGFSELLGDPDFEEDQKKEFIQHITASGNNLLTIISDIMDISKMESGEIILRKKYINAHEYVLGIYEQFSFQAETHKLELILNLPDNEKETEIFADAERLRQIFNNLIGNALKFTSNGSIEIGYRHKGEMVEFFVKDTGIGISASYHHKIFDRFRQVEDEKNRKYGGNGLGLTITKTLVDLMGGKIWVDSEEGKGSAFYFTMPSYNDKLE